MYFFSWPQSASFESHCFQTFSVLQGPPGLCSLNKNTSAGRRTGARMCWRISTMCLYPHANAAGLVRWWHHWVWGLRTWGVDVWCSPLGFLTWGQGAPQVPKARPWCCSTGWAALTFTEPHLATYRERGSESLFSRWASAGDRGECLGDQKDVGAMRGLAQECQGWVPAGEGV